MLSALKVLLAVALVGVGLPSEAQTRTGGINTGPEAFTGPLVPASPGSAWEIYDGDPELAADALLAAKGVSTPHGVAQQATSAEALALQQAVESGAPVFRQGGFGVQQTGNAQFWSPQNPARAANFAEGAGMNGTNAVDWMMKATVKPGTNFVTRPSPAFGSNPGGSLEAVTPPGAVKIEWFHMP